MLSGLLELLPLWAFVVACLVTLFAGLVKGAIGFALPLIIVSGLSIVIDPHLALAGVILPALFSNLLQAAQHPVPEIKDAIHEHWRFIFMVCLVIVIVAQVVVLLPQRAFFLILGVPVVGLSLVQLLGWRMSIPPHRRRTAEWVIGGLAGVTGGITGSWGPPTVLYLMALGTPKARQMLVQGVIYSIGAVALVAGHVQSGVLTGATFLFSALLLIPTFIGMKVGFLIGERLDGERIRKIILLVLIVAGVNLIRRGVFG